MQWCISHRSALEFWRTAQAEDALSRKRLRINKLPGKAMDARGLRVGDPGGLSMPLHILVGSKNARKATQRLHCHICSATFPGGSFIQVASDRAVSSPELCFLQMASELPLIELVTLGFEFCGGYRLDKTADPARGFRDDAALSSVAKLGSYLKRARGIKGRKNALCALKFIVDGSDSPMETALCMLLTLPYRLGGYGFPQPLLNSCIYRTGGTRKAISEIGTLKFYGDLYWPDKRVDVEYDSDAFHAAPTKITEDAIRRNTLSAAGITVLTVSRRQIVQTEGLRAIARSLSARLGKRLKCSTQDFTARHSILRSRLLPKVSADR